MQLYHNLGINGVGICEISLEINNCGVYWYVQPYGVNSQAN